MCGASSQQSQIEATQQKFYEQMTSQYATIFGENQGILTALTKSFQPILDKGINQTGFSTAELQNMESQATTGTGRSYAGAKAALAAQQGAEGGGNTYIPSGAKSQQQQELASSMAQNESGIESNIMASDYAAGRQNYMEAAGILGGVAGQYNPTGFANAATGAGSAAATTANQIVQANQAAFNSVAGMVSGAAGSAASSMLGGL